MHTNVKEGPEREVSSIIVRKVSKYIWYNPVCHGVVHDDHTWRTFGGGWFIVL